MDKKITIFSVLLVFIFSMITIPAYATSSTGQVPWTKYYADPSATRGDERAVAQPSSGQVYVHIDDGISRTSRSAQVVYNVDENSSTVSTPSVTVTSPTRISNTSVFVYDGNIKADAWGGTAKLIMKTKIYKNGNFVMFGGSAEADGVGKHTNTGKTTSFSFTPSGGTFTASSFVKAVASTSIFGGEQKVDFYNYPYHAYSKSIKLET